MICISGLIQRENLVAGDIGYDITGASNSVDLPSHSAIDGWGSKKPAFQRGYAFACIEADSKNRQFHDRHPAYSEFVVKVLNKIAAKLEVNEIPGCGKKNCGGAKTKPFDPPYALEQRLRAISSRLVQYLWGEETSWRKPIMTSRFALMYQKRALRMSQSQARKELKVDNFR